MTPLRKQSARNDGLPVSYLNDVTEEQVRKIDELVHEEFESGDWVAVVRWSRLSEQIFRLDKWNLCQG